MHMSMQNTEAQAQNLWCFMASPFRPCQAGPHAGCADGHGGGVVEQRRGGGRQHAADPQGQQAGIDGQDGAVVAADAPEHPLGQEAQGGQLPEIGGEQGDVRHLPGQVGGVLHGHGHVGGGQGGSR